MSVRLYYVDESHDDKVFCLSAFGVRHGDWASALEIVRQHRKLLRNQYGVRLRYELHATELVSGRGRPAGETKPNPSRFHRSKIFKSCLTTLASIPDVTLINVCLHYHGRQDAELVAWDRLLNRIERSASHAEQQYRARLLSEWTSARAPSTTTPIFEKILKSRVGAAVVFADKGRENDVRRALRRMRAFNPIPSNRGEWPEGTASKNLVLQRIVEDPVFRDSSDSLFLQLADAAAFALLKREVAPTPNIQQLKIHQMFNECLAGICNVNAHRADPLGVVRK